MELKKNTMYKLTCCNPRKISVISSLVTKPTFCIALTYASLPFYKKHSLIILNKYTLYNYMSQINQVQLTILNRPFNRVMVHTEFWGERSRTFQGLFKDFFSLSFDIEWHEVKTFQIHRFAYCNTFPQEGTVSRVL